MLRARRRCWPRLNDPRCDNAFVLRLPEIAAAQVLTMIRLGQVAAAARLAGQYDLPLSQARVLLAQDDPAAAMAVLEPLGRRLEAQGWADELLRALVLQAVAQHAIRGGRHRRRTR